MIIIKYYYIYKYSHAETCRLTVFCVKLYIFIAILWYRWAAEEVVLDICAFVLRIVFVRGMQEILFYNIVYAYACKICEKLGGCWWSFSWLGQSRARL